MINSVLDGVRQTENRAQTTQPKVNSSSIEKKGLLQKIKSYETRHESTAGQAQYMHDTSVTTALDLLLEGGEVFLVGFNCFVGCEMVGQKVVYRQTTEDRDGMFYGRHLKDKTIIQELIPENKSLPVYRAVNVDSLR